MGPTSRVASAATAFAVALAVVIQTRTDSALVADVCYLGVLIGASVAAWIGVQRWPRESRLMPRLIAAGVTLNALGEVIWTALERSGGDPDVSIADLAWFCSYILLCTALWVVLSRSRKDGRADLGVVVDAVTVVVISVLVFWRLTVDPIVSDTTVSLFVRVVWASYPVMDAVFLALALRVILSRSARAAIDAWFAVGVCLWLVADILYLFAPEQELAVTIMNAAWMVAPVLMARAAWSVREIRPDADGGSAVTNGWVGLLLIAVCPLIVPAALELAAHLRGRPDQPWQLFIGMTVVIALALVRTGRLILSEQRAQRELEVARDAALAASQAKSMFLANMSHEIRTPLTTMIATSELLTTTPLNEFQLRLVGMMSRSGERLRSLVDGLLDFSRIEAGRAVVEREEFDLRALVTDVAATHQAGATRHGIRFDHNVDPRVPRVLVGDRTRVFQILSNLVENALKFTEHGRVHLDIRPVDEDTDASEHLVQFSVADTGIGISEEDQATVFESFRQVDGSSTRRYEGTGLGLAICKEVTELMGGTITVSSELGAGSTFTVRLPLTPADPAGSRDMHPTGVPGAV